MPNHYSRPLALCVLVCSFLATSALSAQTADLSLALAQTLDPPARYTFYEVTATVANDGPDAATGVRVALPLPAGAVYAGGEEFVASQGTFGPNGRRVWEVGTLSPGTSAFITLRLFLLAPAPSDYYGQIVASDAADPDSTPGNGSPGAVNEDDEASVELGTGDAGLGAGADLSLALVRTGGDIAFATYTLTATLRNDGPRAATGVVVSVPFDQGAGAVFTGGKEFVASRGTYSPYGRQRWRVGTLAAGAEATLQLNLYRLRGELPERYAQVAASDVDDPDSTPGNGTPPYRQRG